MLGVPRIVALAAASALLLGCGDDGPPPSGPPVAEASAGAPYDIEELVAAEAGRRPERVADLRAAVAPLAADPDDTTAHLAAGRALMLLDRPSAARWHFERAHGPGATQKTSAQAWYQSGVLELRESRPEQAVAAFESALEIEPDRAAALRDLGRALVELGRDEEALPKLESAAELAPNDPDTALLLALTIEPTDVERAVQLLEDASAESPYHLGALTNLASLYRRVGRTDDADRARERHRELVVLADLGQLDRPEHPDRYLAESRFYAQNGQWGKAREVCASGLAQHPKHAELHFLDGMVSLRAEGPDAAQEAYLRSLELRPNDRRVLEELATLHLGDAPPERSERARAALAEAARLWPTHGPFAKALERVAEH